MAKKEFTWEEKEDLLEVVAAQVKLFMEEIERIQCLTRYNKEMIFNQFMDKQLSILDYLDLDEECQEAIEAECWRRYTTPKNIG